MSPTTYGSTTCLISPAAWSTVLAKCGQTTKTMNSQPRWPTLYEVVNATSEWVRDAMALTKPGDVLRPDQREGNHIYISFEAAEAIGPVIQTILMSPRVSPRLKDQLLRVALAALQDLEGWAHLAPLARVMRAHIIEPYGFKQQNNYLFILKQYFDEQDHVLRANLERFRDDLDVALRK